jgi:hypothetical protein
VVGAHQRCRCSQLPKGFGSPAVGHGAKQRPAC